MSVENVPNNVQIAWILYAARIRSNRSNALFLFLSIQTMSVY